MEAAVSDTFDKMIEAPESGYQTTDITVKPGMLLYVRNRANGGEKDQGFGKILIEDVTETPPSGIKIIIQ